MQPNLNTTISVPVHPSMSGARRTDVRPPPHSSMQTIRITRETARE